MFVDERTSDAMSMRLPSGNTGWSTFIEDECKSTPSISAEDAFKLYDTFGFPIDLTQIMAEERGLTVDVEGFHHLMDEARERSRAGGGGESADAYATLPGDAVASLQKIGVARVCQLSCTALDTALRASVYSSG